MVLGLIEGVEVQHATSAIGGDPMEVSVFGTAISIRKQQAGCFQVTPISSNG
jgi:Fe2+ transport system protein FeoA